MASRRCLVCKRMGSQQELIRLHSHDGELRTKRSKSGNQRSVWLCHQSKCLDAMTVQPGRARAGLRQRIHAGPNWHQISSEQRWKSVESALKFCMRSGLVDRLPTPELSAIPAKWIALLWGQPTINSPKLIPEVIEKPIEVFHLPVSEEALGAAIGRPPCAGLLIQSGKPSRRLIRQLHRFVRTG